jgi:hypothetical protein
MKMAEMVSVPAGTGFTWKWRAADSRAESDKSFEFYHDCVEDARKHGYSVKGGTQVDNEPNGNRPDLGNWRLP